MEIERKFLIHLPLPEFKFRQKIIQAYLFSNEGREMRVRICDQVATITIKIALNNTSREEFEIPISLNDALKLIELASPQPPILKIRHITYHQGLKWEVDIFEERNQGLILAEIELNSVDQMFDRPSWLADEVTHDKRYYNAYLYQNPYEEW
ncbi:MAG: CYTH domain-containing protein [Bacteriovorax sp.]|nr:CYTH domain-containing protein [Bacteriovorax sp.]